MSVEIYHIVCGRPALRYAHMPVAGEQFLSKYAATLNGDPIFPGIRPKCGSCGRGVKSILELAPPPLKTYDMTSSEDMQELYGTTGIDETA